MKFLILHILPRNYVRVKRIYGMSTNIHTLFPAGARVKSTLVWGSLRLAPIISGKISMLYHILHDIIFLVSSNLNTSDTPWTDNSWYFGTNVIFNVSSCVYVEEGEGLYNIMGGRVCHGKTTLH